MTELEQLLVELGMPQCQANIESRDEEPDYRCPNISTTYSNDIYACDKHKYTKPSIWWGFEGIQLPWVR